jgi:peptidoglycan/LPS O-acetylase OafA/YrhL
MNRAHGQKISLQSIQLLRGIAALSVVYVHVLATTNFGLFGVDIFFVISCSSAGH